LSNGNATASADEQMGSLTRPATPNALSADMLFDSLTTRLDVNDSNDEECGMHSDNDRTLGELCQMLKEVWTKDPSRIQHCHEILVSLTASILSIGYEELRREHVTTLLRTLLFVFEQRKCTTFLDILQTEPDVAYFQMDCWCLVFRILEKKWNELLCLEDGNAYRIFGNRSLTPLVSHTLLQVIDALYSQLLWEEYGATPAFDARAFGKLRVLCVRIGKVVPLLSAVCAQMKKLDIPRWHASLTSGQKENELVKEFYLSAIDPLMHKRFLMSGESLAKAEQPRLKSFKYKIPRREIEAAWAIIGFFSCCATRNEVLSAPNFKLPQELLYGLVHYKCGTLPNCDHQLPPSKVQVDTCSKEIKWIDTLLSSKLLGGLPSMDSVVKQIVEKCVMLEAFDNVLNMLPSPVAQVKINKVVKQLWRYSRITGSSVELESDLQTGLMDVLSVNQIKNNVCCVTPSALLLQRCVSLVARYATITMTKKPRWKGFRTVLLSLASEFDKRASELEAKSESKKRAGSQSTADAFSEMFQSIETAIKSPIVKSPISSHLREAACHIMLAGVVARSRHNAPGEGNHFTLNNDFREKVR
jgi:hypothetical protein